MPLALPPSNSSSARLAIVSDTSGSPFGASGATHDINTDVVWPAEFASECIVNYFYEEEPIEHLLVLDSAIGCCVGGFDAGDCAVPF